MQAGYRNGSYVKSQLFAFCLPHVFLFWAIRSDGNTDATLPLYYLSRLLHWTAAGVLGFQAPTLRTHTFSLSTSSPRRLVGVCGCAATAQRSTGPGPRRRSTAQTSASPPVYSSPSVGSCGFGIKRAGSWYQWQGRGLQGRERFIGSIQPVVRCETPMLYCKSCG